MGQVPQLTVQTAGAAAVSDPAEAMVRTAGARVVCFRHVAGGEPNSRLNARLNAASESYPTSSAIKLVALLVVRKRCAASVSRHCVRYCMGGWPMSSTKRSANDERDSPI